MQSNAMATLATVQSHCHFTCHLLLHELSNPRIRTNLNKSQSTSQASRSMHDGRSLCVTWEGAQDPTLNYCK
jgi:hypothetical protein